MQSIIIFAFMMNMLFGTSMYNTSVDTIQSTSQSMNQAEVSTFNAKFEQYSGNLRGAQVRALIQSVMMSNTSSDKKVVINFNNTNYSDDNISTLNSNISAQKNYNVKCDYDSNGYVNLISINDI